MTPTPPPGRRPGMTLTEVLVALFVMALGLISLLTLFPVGAIQIGLALRDDRCKQTGVQADGFLRAYWRSMVTDKIAAGQQPDDFVWAMDDPNWRSPTTKPTASTLPAGDPSFPVLIDPLGFLSQTGVNQTGVAGEANFPRRSLGYVDAFTSAPGPSPTFTSTRALQMCVLLDDLTFDRNGAPENNSGVVSRLGKYNWAAILRRSTNSATARERPELTILCFGDRPPLLNAGAPENRVTSATAIVGQPLISNVPVPAALPGMAPPLRKGGWVMDGTIEASPAVRNAKFYRIIGVTDVSAGVVNLDVDPPFDFPGAAAGTSKTPTLYFFSGLTEVFVRPPLTP